MLPLLILLFSVPPSFSNPFQECVKLFNPQNYMDRLPSLSMPYVNNIPIPNPQSIKPSPVKQTKVINVVTKYIYKNPVCVKVSGKKSPCKPKQNHKNNMEFLITKEYTVNDRNLHLDNQRHSKLLDEDILAPEANSFNEMDLFIEASEEGRPFKSKASATPNLSKEELHDLLIEDRLDQLETILPHYTRRRVYQTSTITVTKVRNNNRATATLMVKNCIPQGYDLCPKKNKKRKSKVAVESDDQTEVGYFG